MKEKHPLNYTKDSDIENTFNEKFQFDDKEVFKVTKENEKIKYVWYTENNLYTVLSSLHEKEILKFIENIKILKNF